ncbi:class I SAM-dependent RNA methyltransferase [Microvirga sp. 3-52]|uniref:class I SAM-dependent RNA methyltransferase n=1 Tax=Microvirga sp. 3-52 TaxID=2792425 RepID=UPI001AC97640|nr:RNA methyltransferase [Microvirga sp. 3-52]MBO1904566.1 class I SAM-dependent RNA methyltransferase [Microvirga sp. 3-52]MBS7451894.1 class I SAM-dependent RNA methyltransferase [Microvirga sp. 3-52]
MAEQVTIRRLGAKGDGIADTSSGPVFVPKVLPGETVSIERDGSHARLVSVDVASPERETPFCPYFDECGGCATQHMKHGFYQAWKQETLVHTLRQARIEAPVEPLIDAHGDGRRRVTLHVRFPDRAMQVGFMAPRSHQIVEIAFCPITEPALKEQAPAIARAVGEHLKGPRKPLDIQITATQTGFDVDVRGYGPLKDPDRLRLIDLAAGLDLSRLSIHGDVIVERRPPAIVMGRAAVVPPAGSFLQATKLGEETLAGFVTGACARAKRIADLFAGTGPFSLRLAEKSDVHAVEFDKGSMVALDKAVRATPGLRRVTTEARDLFRRPLLTPELNAFDAVVLDPPRAGAEAQAKQLAASKVPLVVSVSCDAATFARDAAILIGSGYRLERVIPVDQFKHSPHLEVVGILRRDMAKKLSRRT